MFAATNVRLIMTNLATRTSLFVTGIGTEVGKTVCAAILTEALQADYWKPIQAGALEHTDTDEVRSLVRNEYSYFWRSAYQLALAASPHWAAQHEGVDIRLASLGLPQSKRRLIVEGAGGIMSPVNDQCTMLDMLAMWSIPTVVVSRHYLGSINHTLLTVQALRSRGIFIVGLIFNGTPHPPTESYILNHTQLPLIGRLLPHDTLTPDIVSGYAQQWKPVLVELLEKIER